MNAWGWAFVAPVLALLVVDTTYAILLLIATIGWTAVWLWLTNKAIGPK